MKIIFDCEYKYFSVRVLALRYIWLDDSSMALPSYKNQTNSMIPKYLRNISKVLHYDSAYVVDSENAMLNGPIVRTVGGIVD